MHAYTWRRLRAKTEEQKQLIASLDKQVQEKQASQSGELKLLSEEAAALRAELKSVVEETQVHVLRCGRPAKIWGGATRYQPALHVFPGIFGQSSVEPQPRLVVVHLRR